MSILKMLIEEYCIYVSSPRKPNFLFSILAFIKSSHFRVVIYLRLMQKYGGLVSSLLQIHLLRRYGIEVPLNPKIGKKLRIMHLSGIVIGDGCEIGDECILYQGVTIGQRNNRYPKIQNGVCLYPYATIIGDVKVGNNATVLAHSVVTHDVPENVIVGGIPARIIKTKLS